MASLARNLIVFLVFVTVEGSFDTSSELSFGWVKLLPTNETATTERRPWCRFN